MQIEFLKLPLDVQNVFDRNIGCRNALKNLVVGRNPTPMSWFYEDKSPEWCLSQVVSQLESSSKDLKDLSDWDLGFVPKYGPQGEAAPLRDRLDTFEEYFLHIKKAPILSDKIFQQAQRNMIKLFGFNQTGIPYSAEKVVDEGMSQDKYGTNSAYDLYVKKKNPKARLKAIQDAPICISAKFPTTPGSRATPGKTGKDARWIFMTAMAVVVNGQRYQKPLQEYIRKKNIEFFAPWNGFENVQKIVSTFDDDTVKLSADYDKMDQHFNLYHGLAVYDVVKHYFKPEFHSDLKEIITYVFTQPLLVARDFAEDGKTVIPEYIDQLHALVSGSEWTNFLETVWNMIFWEYMKLKYHLKIQHALGIGDDQLLEFDTGRKWNDVKLDKLLDIIIQEFDYAGTPGNKEKNLFSRDKFDFCQRRAIRGYNGFKGDTKWALVYRITRCLEMNKFPETYHNDTEKDSTGSKVRIYNKYTFAIQVIMRSENLIQHWLFKWWIDFIWACNPVIKEFVLLKNSEVLEQEKRARKLTNLYVTYNQEKAERHITEFETFKMLRNKL